MSSSLNLEKSLLDTKIGSLSSIDVFEDENTWILAGSDKYSSIVSVWPEKASTAEHLGIHRGHSDGITCLSFAPKSGKFFVSGSIDRTCRLFRPKDDSTTILTSTPFKCSKIDSSQINSVDVSPTENIFASGGKDHTLTIWDVNRNSQPIRTTRTGGGSVTHVQFSPYDPNILACIRRGSLVLMDVRENANERRSYTNNDLTQLVWQDENNLILCIGSMVVKGDLRASKFISLVSGELQKGNIASLAINSNKPILAVSDSAGIHFFDNDRYKYTLPQLYVSAIAFSQITDQLIFGKSNGIVCNFPPSYYESFESVPLSSQENSPSKSANNSSNGSKLHDKSPQALNAATISPLRSTSPNSSQSQVKTLDSAKSQSSSTKTSHPPKATIAIQSNPKSTSPKVVIPKKNGKKNDAKNALQSTPKVDSNSPLVGSSDSSDESLNNEYDEITEESILKTANELFRKHNVSAGSARPIYDVRLSPRIVYSAAISSECRNIISGCSSSSRGNLVLWKADRHMTIYLKGHTDEVRSVDYSPNNSFFITGSDDCKVLLWNPDAVDSSPSHALGHTGQVKSVHIDHTSSSFCSASADETVKLWTCENSSPPTLKANYSLNSLVNAAKFHPENNQLIATASKNSGVHLIDTLCPTPKKIPKSSDLPNLSVSWNPIQTNYLATGTWNSIRIWDIRYDKEPFQLIKVALPCLSIAYNPSGTQLVSTFHCDSSVKIFSSHPSNFKLQEISSLYDTYSKTIWSACYNRNGTEIITAGGSPGRVAIWPNKFISPVDEHSFIGSDTTDSALKTVELKSPIQIVKRNSPSSNTIPKTLSESTATMEQSNSIGKTSQANGTNLDSLFNSNFNQHDSSNGVTNLVTPKLIEELLDAKLTPLRRTISQLETKLNSASLLIKQSHDIESTLKRTIAEQGERLRNNDKVINDLKIEMHRLSAHDGHNENKNVLIAQKLEEAIEKLKSDMDRVSAINNKTNLNVFDLKVCLNELQSKIPQTNDDKSPSSNSSGIGVKCSLVIIAASLLSYCYLKMK